MMHNDEDRSGPKLLSTWVQPSLHERLAAIAREHDRSIAAEPRHLVRQHLEPERATA